MNISKAMLRNVNQIFHTRYFNVWLSSTKAVEWCNNYLEVKLLAKCTLRSFSVKRSASLMKNLNLLNETERKKLFDSVDNVLTDCDGVLWLGETIIPGANDVINELKEVGKNIYFVTNNSTKSRVDLLNKSKKLGFQLSLDSMISSSWLTAAYLKSMNFNKKVYVVGSKAIVDELSEVGIESFGSGRVEVSDTITADHLVYDCDVGAVVVGHDIYFNYTKMTLACNYLKDPKCLFIATNTDPNLPLHGNMIAPGAGSFVKAIETCAGRAPIAIGKPSTLAVEKVLKCKGLDPLRSIMIGDRGITDIAFGNRANMKTLLVLTGVDSLDDVKKHEEKNELDMIPTYYSDSIKDLNKIIKNN